MPVTPVARAIAAALKGAMAIPAPVVRELAAMQEPAAPLKAIPRAVRPLSQGPQPTTRRISSRIAARELLREMRIASGVRQ